LGVRATLIFDLDGTLIDSFEQILQCCKKVRKRLKMPYMTDSDIKALIGLPAVNLFCDDPGIKVEEAVQLFRSELKIEICSGNKLFPGVETLLNKLRAKDINIAIATSKPHELALLVVKNSRLDELVDYVQGIDGFPAKPDPAVINRCQDALPAKKFSMIGDRIEDIVAGQKAGCYSIGIAQGFSGETDFQKVGAHETFLSIEELSNNLDLVLTRMEMYG